MRLIDADALDEARIDYIVSGYANSPEDCAEFGMMIIKAPTACDIEGIEEEIIESLRHQIIVPEDDFDSGENAGIRRAVQVVKRAFREYKQTEESNEVNKQR